MARKAKKKTSIDKMIEKCDDNSDFDEMTAQLGEKIIGIVKPDVEDDDDGFYEEIKDTIRDHLVSWRENSNIQECSK